MILRSTYLEKLQRLKDKQTIKVLTGVRRCGKSTILEMFQEQLLNDGVQESQIISMDFEDLVNEKYLDYHELFHFLEEKMENT